MQNTPLQSGTSTPSGQSGQRTPASASFAAAASDASRMMSDVTATFGSLFGNTPSRTTPSSSSSSSASASQGVKQGSGTNVLTGGKKPEEIPKEELMSLCMKMSKRMQGLEKQYEVLSRHKKALLVERKKLLNHIRETTPSSLVEAMPDPNAAVSLRILPQDDEAMQLDVAALTLLRVQHEQTRAIQVKQFRDQLKQLGGSIVTQSASASATLQTSPLSTSATTDGATEQQQNSSEDSSASSSSSSSDPLSHFLAESEKEKEKIPNTSSSGTTSTNAATETAENKVVAAELATARILIDEYKEELDRASNQIKAMQGLHSATEQTLKERADKKEATLHEVTGRSAKLEEKVIQLQLQVKGLKSTDDTARNLEAEIVTYKQQIEGVESITSELQRVIDQKDDQIQNSRDIAKALQENLRKKEIECDSFQKKLKDSLQNLSAASMLKEEHEGNVDLMQQEISLLNVQKDELEGQLRKSEKERLKNESSSERVSFLEARLASLQTDITDKDAMITRLRGEAQTSERSHAVKTAQLATSEAQLEALKIEIEAKATTANEALERVKLLQTRIEQGQKSILEIEAKLEQIKLENETKVAELLAKHNSDIVTKDEERESAISTLNREHTKSSNIARSINAQKEEENIILGEKIKVLQEEISSGAPNERRIFELAASQAKREAIHGSHRDARELAFIQLQEALMTRDMEVAQHYQARTALEKELDSLRRSAKRDGVNMAYLKNVVLQFMTFPMAAPERLSLVPVIATLLQFTREESKNAITAARSPSWAPLQVKDIFAGMSSGQQQVPRPRVSTAAAGIGVGAPPKTPPPKTSPKTTELNQRFQVQENGVADV